VKLAVFGAAGGTGRFLLTQAIERGHSVTAFVRSGPGKESRPGVDRVVTGDARNPSAVRSALRGAEAVVSAMGPQGPEPGDVYSNAIGELTRAMGSAGPRRLVISANSRVLDDLPLEGPYAAVSQEHRDVLACLLVADLDWTVVATPMLSDEEPRGGYQAVVDGRGDGPSISRADYATALLDALDHPGWIGHVVDVSTAA
jgi:putative NADH-flavin reductase